MLVLVRSVVLSLVLSVWIVFVSADQFSEDYDKYNSYVYGTHPRQAFKSTGIHFMAPLLLVNVWNKTKTSTFGSHIFLRHGTYPSSALILDARDLSTVYVHHRYGLTSDVRVQKNFNTSYLTFYSGLFRDGHGDGYGMVLDDHYNEVYKITPQNLKVKADLHEFQLTGNGTAIMTAYELWTMDSGDWILDGVFQEVDLETQEVLFQWRASEHVNLNDSYVLRPESKEHWDFFHINSVEKVGLLSLCSICVFLTD